MQISSGWAKGLRLTVPEGLGTRPTSSKVRAAIANMIAPYVGDAMVLDVFAGSGALGLEAVSRGARGAVLVESGAAALKCLRANVAAMEARGSKQDLNKNMFTVVGRDAGEACGAAAPSGAAAFAASIVGRAGPYDVIAMDPPYDAAYAWFERLAPAFAAFAAPDATLVVETGAGDLARLQALAEPFPWVLVKERSYGDTMVTIWEAR